MKRYCTLFTALNFNCLELTVESLRVAAFCIWPVYRSTTDSSTITYQTLPRDQGLATPVVNQEPDHHRVQLFQNRLGYTNRLPSTEHLASVYPY